MASDVSTLFVVVFVACIGWVGVASAVAVGVEYGLKRYRGELTRLGRPDSGDEDSRS